MKKSAPRWIAIIALACVIFLIAVHVSGARSEGFRFLAGAIRNDAIVREQLGTVETVSLSFFGNYREKTVGENKWLTMDLNVSGEKRSGTVLAHAEKTNGVWSVSDAFLDGRPISLH